MSEYSRLATAGDAAEELAQLQIEIARLEVETSGVEPPVTPPTPAELQRTVEQLQLKVEQLETPRPVRRDSVSEASASGAIPRHELEAALAENAKLRQVVSSAKAVADDAERMRVLATVDVQGESPSQPRGTTVGGPPKVPSGFMLRKTSATKTLRGGLYFTHDAQTLVHGGSKDSELSLWDLGTATRTVGVSRSGGIVCSALSPDGRLLCVAAKDGLAMYHFTPRNVDSGTSPSCSLKWEAECGTAYCDVTFSRDGTIVASARGETGVVEIRDVDSNSTLHTIEDFPAVFTAMNWCHGLAFSHELLAVAGRDTKQKKVRLFSTADRGMQVLKTLEFEHPVHNIRFNHAGSSLAIGALGKGPLLVYSASNSWDDPPLVLGEKNEVCSLSFSHDDRLLCAGYIHDKTFGLWDLEAEVCIRIIPGGGEYHACSFSPADDLLAIGGDCGNPVSLCELLPRGPLDTFAMPGDAKLLLDVAVASDTVVVVASGKQLAALCRANRAVLWEMDVEDISAEFYPVALQPSGGQMVVCMRKLRIAKVYDVLSGKELYTLGPYNRDDQIAAADYSPSGDVVFVHGNFGTVVYSAAHGEQLHSFVDKPGAWVHSCRVDTSGKLLATTGHSGGVCSIKDLESGKNLHTWTSTENTQGLSFDDAGDLMAYSTSTGAGDGEGCAQTEDRISICDVKDGFRELRRFTVRDWVWVHLQFSPGNGEILLAKTHKHFERKAGRTGTDLMAFLDPQTGEELPWSRCFRALMLPAGDIKTFSIRWVPSVGPSSQHGTTGEKQSPPPPLILQATVDDQLHLIDVTAFIRSFEQDGNFSADQLIQLSDNDPDGIPGFAKRWPYAINVRDEKTGKTVLDHCIATDNVAAAAHWLSGPIQIFNVAQLNTISDCVPHIISKLLARSPGLVAQKGPDGRSVLHHCALAVTNTEADELSREKAGEEKADALLGLADGLEGELADFLGDDSAEEPAIARDGAGPRARRRKKKSLGRKKAMKSDALENGVCAKAQLQALTRKQLKEKAYAAGADRSMVDKAWNEEGDTVTVSARGQDDTDASSSGGAAPSETRERASVTLTGDCETDLIALIMDANEKQAAATRLKRKNAAQVRRIKAKSRQQAASSWLGESTYSLSFDSDNMCALGLAIMSNRVEIADCLVQRLNPKMPLDDTGLLLTELLRVAKEWPRELVHILSLLEDGNGYGLFRKQDTVKELSKQLEGFEVRDSHCPDAELLEERPWNDYSPTDAGATVKCECTLEVLALKGFTAVPKDDTDPPYQQLFEACESQSKQRLEQLLGTKLMIAATAFMWKTYVMKRVTHRLCYYGLHFVLAATAMLMSSQFAEQYHDFRSNGGWTGGEWSSISAAMFCDVLVFGVVVTNTIVLSRELLQLKQLCGDQKNGCKDVLVEYFVHDLWNLVDMIGIVALYVAAVGHFWLDEFLLQQMGAVGVLANAFSLLQLLQPFDDTGPLIATLAEIVTDIRGYMIIIAVLLWGFSVSFAVSMPDNSAFEVGAGGPIVGILTSFKAILGTFKMRDYTNYESKTFFVIFLLLNVIVMLNLLIAIMTDTFERVKESEELQGRRLKAEKIIIEMKQMSAKEKKNEQYFPEFLQVLEADEAKENTWSGLGGKIASEIDKTEEARKKDVEKAKHTMDEMRAEVDSVKAQVGSVEAKVEEMNKKMTAEMSEVKALLSLLIEGQASAVARH